MKPLTAQQMSLLESLYRERLLSPEATWGWLASERIVPGREARSTTVSMGPLVRAGFAERKQFKGKITYFRITEFGVRTFLRTRVSR